MKKLPQQAEAVVLDGRLGEGGGQLLRSALSLSMLSGRPMRISSIRAGRPRPGLMRQHLACVRAAEQISEGRVWGADLGSTKLDFTPGAVRGGNYHFSVGSAGSANLVLQTVLLPLLAAEKPSHLRIEGGTHNAWAPSADFLQMTFLPLLRQMGATVEFKMNGIGFFPAGGGAIEVNISPLADNGKPWHLEAAVASKSLHAWTHNAHLEASVPSREWSTLKQLLPLAEQDYQEYWHPQSPGPGNTLQLAVGLGNYAEVFTGFAARGKPARRIARELAKEVHAFLDAKVPVGRHLADQLLLPLALMRGGSFLTSEPSRHLLTNIEILHAFHPGAVAIEQVRERAFLIRVVDPRA